MKYRDLIFIVIVLAVVGGLYYLSTKNRAKPLSPNPPEHLTVKAREDCLKCHIPATLAELEQQHKHPGKWRDARVSCMLCHTAPQGAKAKRERETREISETREKFRAAVSRFLPISRVSRSHLNIPAKTQPQKPVASSLYDLQKLHRRPLGQTVELFND